MSQENVEVVRRAFEEFTRGGGEPLFGTFRFDEWEQELDDVIDCGDQVVVALTRQRGRGSASGANVELEYAQVITLHEGKVVRVDVYLDRERALEDVGLS